LEPTRVHERVMVVVRERHERRVTLHRRAVVDGTRTTLNHVDGSFSAERKRQPGTGRPETQTVATRPDGVRTSFTEVARRR
jgi:hypothetical protein